MGWLDAPGVRIPEDLSFWTKAEPYRVFGVALMDPHTPLAGRFDLVADQNWVQHEVQLMVEATVSNRRFAFVNLGANTGNLQLTDITQTRIE